MKRKLDCVILIDDDRATNFLHKLVLNKVVSVENVAVFQNAEEALVFINEYHQKTGGQPDLILLDINMPEMNGWEFLEVYNGFKESVQARVLKCMLSTDLGPSDKIQAKKLMQNHGFLNKPLTEEMLTELIDKELNE